MKNLLGNVVRVVLGALVVYSCAGKSISRTDGDDPPPSADDGFAGGRPGAGGAVVGGGGTVGLGGTTTGKGGGGRGGTIGTSGTAGRGGRGGSSGTSGVGGTGNLGGDDGIGGAGGDDGPCVPNPPGRVSDAPCNESKSCVSLLAPPSPVFIRRNQPAAQPPPGDAGAGGGDGAGGASGDPREDMASARFCEPEGANGFLAFDYYSSADPSEQNWVLLVSGDQRICGGGVLGRASFLDFAAPPPGTWTTQCLEVTRSEFDDSVSIDVPPWALVRNLRMVTRCECPRALTRYTTCGPYTSSYCQ